jgi:hypothetical protein
MVARFGIQWSPARVRSCHKVNCGGSRPWQDTVLPAHAVARRYSMLLQKPLVAIRGATIMVLFAESYKQSPWQFMMKRRGRRRGCMLQLLHSCLTGLAYLVMYSDRRVQIICTVHRRDAQCQNGLPCRQDVLKSTSGTSATRVCVAYCLLLLLHPRHNLLMWRVGLQPHAHHSKTAPRPLSSSHRVRLLLFAGVVNVRWELGAGYAGNDLPAPIDGCSANVPDAWGCAERCFLTPRCAVFDYRPAAQNSG